MCKKQTVLRLPLPPSANTYYRRAGTWIHISSKGREFAKQVLECVRCQRGHQPIEGPVAVGIVLFFPTKRICDIDNRIKPLLDALTKAGVWFDDSQVRELRVVDSGKTVKGGECVVTIEELKSKGESNVRN